MPVSVHDANQLMKLVDRKLEMHQDLFESDMRQLSDECPRRVVLTRDQDINEDDRMVWVRDK